MTTPTDHFDARMTQRLHIILCNTLITDMDSPADCDHTFEHTHRVLAKHAPRPDEAMAWLHDHGAYCDCEVLFNTMPESPDDP
jgi:hypothetical protein